MTIALFGTEKIDLQIVADELRREDISATPYPLRRQSSPIKFDKTITHGIVIFPDPGVVSIGDPTAKVRQTLPQHIPLILCSSQVTADDREILLKCGASILITPQSWSAIHIAERITAQLILEGLIQLDSSGPLKGATRRMRELYDNIQILAPLSDSILILGETGTGKELVAQELHNRSNRPKSFLPVNCPGINRELVGSELFGHEKGAFTNAIQKRAGLLVAAGGGTVFLDEIGDLELTIQSNLLRLLEEKRVLPVGSNKWEDVHARIVMATNRDLERACAEGKFRSDLYQRMKGFEIVLPPLRERKADIPLLVNHFVDAFSREYNKPLSVPDGALDYLFRYDWPGNVRELRNVVRRAAAYADSAGRISSIVLQESVRGRAAASANNSVSFDPIADDWQTVKERAQKAYINAVLNATGGNVTKAAKLADLSRSQFYQLWGRAEANTSNEEE